MSLEGVVGLERTSTEEFRQARSARRAKEVRPENTLHNITRSCTHMSPSASCCRKATCTSDTTRPALSQGVHIFVDNSNLTLGGARPRVNYSALLRLLCGPEGSAVASPSQCRTTYVVGSERAGGDWGTSHDRGPRWVEEARAAGFEVDLLQVKHCLSLPCHRLALPYIAVLLQRLPARSGGGEQAVDDKMHGATVHLPCVFH